MAQMFEVPPNPIEVERSEMCAAHDVQLRLIKTAEDVLLLQPGHKQAIEQRDQARKDKVVIEKAIAAHYEAAAKAEK